MPTMSGADRVGVGGQFQINVSRRRDSLAGLLKADVQAAVAAVDDWVVANQASFNAALPLPARTSLTAAQKAELLALVLQRRYDVGA